jgi:hypothetical protein
MSEVKKAGLRAEISRLREELAAEKARSETLREHAHCHGCTCAHAAWVYPYVPTYPASPTPVWTSQPYTVTCASDTTGFSTATLSGVTTTNAALS